MKKQLSSIVNIHGRSGKVALLRVKVVLARAARLVIEGAAALRAVRIALLLRSVLDILVLNAFIANPEALGRKQEEQPKY